MANLTHICPQNPTHRLAIPYATVTEGSVRVKVVHGVTRWHAVGRAVKWAQRNGADGSLRVMRWG